MYFLFYKTNFKKIILEIGIKSRFSITGFSGQRHKCESCMLSALPKKSQTKSSFPYEQFASKLSSRQKRKVVKEKTNIYTYAVY